MLKKQKIFIWCLVPALALSLSVAAQVPANVGELFASEATPNGPLMKAGTGMPVASGSELAAGRSSATLRLERGGEVKICPYSHLSVTSGAGHAALLFALGSSTVELSYPVNELTDTLITPDFKLSLTGPGTFHFAVGVNGRGDTCLRPLRGNSGVIVVSELLGGGAYSLKTDESIVFNSGKVAGRAPLTAPCGCPPPPQVMQAQSNPAATQPASAPLKSPGEPHISAEAPLVFRGDQAVQQSYSVARVNFSRLPNVFLLQEKVEPPPANAEGSKKTQPRKEQKSLFGAIGSFFRAIFRR